MPEVDQAWMTRIDGKLDKIADIFTHLAKQEQIVEGILKDVDDHEKRLRAQEQISSSRGWLYKIAEKAGLVAATVGITMAIQHLLGRGG